MSDEEIEFLGSKPAVPPSLQRPVTGIVLHVEKNGPGAEPYRLTFNRSSSSVIHVGRRPGVESESRTRDIDSGRAMFRCAVVSRKHAKIAFSDSGHVYLIDLSSHHGTHVRKPGELFSKVLQAEVPSPLGDGDLITFGKTVGRHEECVRPVVVRVELVRGPQPIKPLVVPTTPSDKSTSSSSSSRHSSGRYGVYSSYSSDERPSTPSLDNDSEIEMVGGPLAVSSGPSQSKHESIPSSSSGIGRAFDLLKRLIPPSHTPNGASGNQAAADATAPSSAVEGQAFTLAPIALQSEYVADMRFGSPFFDFSDLCSSSSPPTLPPLQDAISFNSNSDALAPVNHNSKSRSHSPMDLESPSPAPASMLELEPLDSMPGELSPNASSRNSPEAETSDDDYEQSSSENRGGSESPSSCDESENEDSNEAKQKSGSDAAAAAPEAVAEAGASPEGHRTALQELKKAVDKLQTDVGKLDTHRRKYRSRFNNNVHRLAEKLSLYDDRLAEVNAQYDNLAEKVETVSQIEIPDITCQLEDMNEQVENLAYVDVPDLQTRVDGLDDDLMGIMKNAAIETLGALDSSEGAEEARNEVNTLRDLVKQMKDLRATTEMQMKESLNEVKELCRTTMANVTAEYSQAQMALAATVANAEASSSTSLKRKRSDDADDVDHEAASPDTTLDMDTTLASDALFPFDLANQDVDMTPSPISSIEPTESTPLIDLSHLTVTTSAVAARPRKRLRTAARVMAQTATAVTIGAVATWSVLAFA